MGLLPVVRGSSLFDPNSITGLLDWWKADAITPQSDNTALASWPNSKSARNLTQTTGTRQPMYRTNYQNGLPAVTFDGTNHGMHYGSGTSIPTADNTLTVSCAVKRLGTAADINGRLVSTNLAGGFDYNDLLAFAVDATHYRRYRLGSVIGADWANDTTSWHVITLLFDGTNSVVYTDGTSVDSAATNNVFSYDSYHMGCDPFDKNHGQFAWGEQLWYDGALSSTDRASLEAYLARWTSTPAAALPNLSYSAVQQAIARSSLY